MIAIVLLSALGALILTALGFGEFRPARKRAHY